MSSRLTLTFALLVDRVIDGFRAAPSSCVLVNEPTLLSAAVEEVGREIGTDELRASIGAFIANNDLTYEEYEVFKGSEYACKVVANNCFRTDPAEDDDDFEYFVDWRIAESGEVSALVTVTDGS